MSKNHFKNFELEVENEENEVVENEGNEVVEDTNEEENLEKESTKDVRHKYKLLQKKYKDLERENLKLRKLIENVLNKYSKI